MAERSHSTGQKPEKWRPKPGRRARPGHLIGQIGPISGKQAAPGLNQQRFPCAPHTVLYCKLAEGLVIFWCAFAFAKRAERGGEAAYTAYSIVGILPVRVRVRVRVREEVS